MNRKPVIASACIAVCAAMLITTTALARPRGGMTFSVTRFGPHYETFQGLAMRPGYVSPALALTICLLALAGIASGCLYLQSATGRLLPGPLFTCIRFGHLSAWGMIWRSVVAQMVLWGVPALGAQELILHTVPGSGRLSATVALAVLLLAASLADAQFSGEDPSETEAPS